MSWYGHFFITAAKEMACFMRWLQCDTVEGVETGVICRCWTCWVPVCGTCGTRKGSR